MVERAYSLKHLSTEQLREMYYTYRPLGWIEGDYYELKPEGVHPPKLTEEEIILNIDAGNEDNYFIFTLDIDDEEDGIMIGFGMRNYNDFGIYLYLPPELLDELVEKYSLAVCHDSIESGLSKYYFSDKQIGLN